MTLARDMRPEATASADENDRPCWPAIRLGLSGHCPQCGDGKIFRAYLKVNDECPSCGEELHHQRADDAPPYLTIFIVGHVVAAMLMIAEDYWPQLDMWVHMVVWPLVATAMSLWLLPKVKGALIAYQWALRMHGFGTTLPSVASRGKAIAP